MQRRHKKHPRFAAKEANIWKNPEKNWRLMVLRMQANLQSQGTKCYTQKMFKIIISMSLPD
jgi:hypothetical protein